MMKVDSVKKVIVKIDSDVQQEHVKNTRKGLKTLQPTALDKENLAGRPKSFKDHKNILGIESKKQKPMLIHKETQTEKYLISEEDLTGEEPSLEYWKRLAEKRQESLDDSLHEIEILKGDIVVLQEENKICKEMLEESKTLVEVLQEMINSGDNEEAEDETHDNASESCNVESETESN